MTGHKHRPIRRTNPTGQTAFAIVGAGRVGTALAQLLAGRGYKFIGAASRSMDSAKQACRLAGAGRPWRDAVQMCRRASIVFITTPDDVIGKVCAYLAGQRAFAPGCVVAHCSGALPSTVLKPARANSALIGSMHPLQTFATAEQAIRAIPGSWCCVEGDDKAVKRLQEVAQSLGMHVLSIPPKGKTLYHAAAVMACNYLVALQHAALKLSEKAGIDQRHALRAHLPMVRQTVRNLAQVGLVQSLTGPVARGDILTVQRHIKAIRAQLPELVDLYKRLGEEAVELATQAGTLSPHKAARLLALFREPEPQER